MYELIVAGFQGKHRAAEVLDEIVTLDLQAAIELKDAVAVYRTNSGKLRVDSSVQPTSTEGAAVGGLIGVILGSLLAVPFTAGASAGIAAAAIGTGALTLGTTGAVIAGEDTAEDKARYGISEDLVQQIGGMVQPGDSAVFVLADTLHPITVVERFRGYGAKILHTTIEPWAAKRLQEVVGSDSALAR